jgi:hypothetical protein
MRRIVLGLCMFAAACSGRGADSPLAPSAATGQGSTQARNGTDLPFQGSFTLKTHAIETPPILRIFGDEEGTATHLGHFTATSLDVVDQTTNTATGTFDFIAANGDRIHTTTVGVENSFTPPNVSHVMLNATIVDGTGRFAGASGSFTIQMVQTIDFSAATPTRSGSVDGRINLGE